MKYRPGRHFLQVPGPTNVPDRVLRAMDRPTIDHRSSDFAELARDLFKGCQSVFQTSQPVMVFASSGTGCWEAAIVNTLSPRDKVLMFETGQFATLWQVMATKLGLEVEFVAGDWRHGVAPEQVHARLAADRNRRIKAVMVVHNETSTGVASGIPQIRRAIDEANHPALLMVDAISSLAAMDYRHDAWGVDVTIAGSQKGLMLPPGLAFNAVSQKALAASKTSAFARSYWDWAEMLQSNSAGFFPYTPATNLLYGLREALAMLQEEGLSNVFVRHQRHAAATRAAVAGWGLEIVALDPREYSSTLTAVLLPQPHDADVFRQILFEQYSLSLGMGLGKLKGKAFRIGHLGDFNDLMLMATLAGVELGLRAARVPHNKEGVRLAMDELTRSPESGASPREARQGAADALTKA